jgi:hypothetical protein
VENKPIIALRVPIRAKQHNNAIKEHKTSIRILLSALLVARRKQAQRLLITGDPHPHRSALPPIPNKHVSANPPQTNIPPQTVLLIIITPKHIFAFGLMFRQIA